MLADSRRRVVPKPDDHLIEGGDGLTTLTPLTQHESLGDQALADLLADGGG